MVLGKYYLISSLRERRIYAANAAVQRWAKGWCACGLGMPRKAGANMAGAIFGGWMIEGKLRGGFWGR